MSTVILACTALKGYVEAAQKVNRTDYPIIYLDRKYHMEPKTMRQLILEAEQKLSPDVDTVLVAMGYCGGSWDQMTFSRKTVIPRVDDCISILLQKTDKFVPNLKEMGHMYMPDIDPNDFDLKTLLHDIPPDIFEEISEDELFELFFANYRYLDVVDTGFNDCYSEEYAAKAQEYADQMNVALEYVKGSNHLLEKLVGGNWDEQFLVAEAGRPIQLGDFI